MAVNRTLKGPKPVKYYADERYRLDWQRVPEEELPKSYKHHYIAIFKGQERGELFYGKTGYWIGLAYGRFTFWCKDVKDAAMHLAALIAGGPSN